MAERRQALSLFVFKSSVLGLPGIQSGFLVQLLKHTHAGPAVGVGTAAAQQSHQFLFQLIFTSELTGPAADRHSAIRLSVPYDYSVRVFVITVLTDQLNRGPGRPVIFQTELDDQFSGVCDVKILVLQSGFEEHGNILNRHSQPEAQQKDGIPRDRISFQPTFDQGTELYCGIMK